MHRVVRFLRHKSEAFHFPIHILIGMICAYFTFRLFPDASPHLLIWNGILGSLLPDVDHLFFFLIYGRHTDYARSVRSLFKNRHFRHLWNFVKINHKSNTGIYSHNFLSLVIVFFAFWYFEAVRDRPSLTVFFLSWGAHYLFDIFEDFLFFKSLNPNWFLKFNRSAKKTYIPPEH